jgi:hypothetical protein
MNEIEKWKNRKKSIVKGLAIYAFFILFAIVYLNYFHVEPERNIQNQDSPLITTTNRLLTKEVKFIHDYAGFTIQVPDTWKVEFPPGKGKDGPAVITRTPDDGDRDKFIENCNVTIGSWTKNVDLSQLRIAHNRGQTGLRRITSDFDELANGETTIGSLLALWSISSWIAPGAPAKTKTLGYMIANDRIVFNVICTALPSTFPNYEHTFRNIAMSFRVTGK